METENLRELFLALLNDMPGITDEAFRRLSPIANLHPELEAIIKMAERNDSVDVRWSITHQQEQTLRKRFGWKENKNV